MESDLGKLFVGGVSWDTDENRLKEYFGQYGEVVEALIMRDRITGRARGFGFIVFADPAVAARVVMNKHMIDGRTVEAKKAIPKDDQHILARNNNSIQRSPGLGRTRKIFVGGLASTVTEADFKKYFDQFGTITDVVVMYDHNTQRPRGFGFITYDSEDAVDRVLHKTFHELNGKLVEVKRAVPKELSPSPNRSPLVGYSYGLSRGNSFINSYGQGHNLSSADLYGRFNPFSTGRSSLPPFTTPGYGTGMGLDPGLSSSYGRVLGPYYSGNSNRHNHLNVRADSVLSPTARNIWGTGSFENPNNPIGANTFFGSGTENFRVLFGSNRGSSPLGSQGGGSSYEYTSGNIDYGFGDGNYGRNNSAGAIQVSSFSTPTHGLDSSYEAMYRSGLVYGGSTWGSSSELENSGSFGYGLGNEASDVDSRTSEGFIGTYSVANRQTNRGIAA